MAETLPRSPELDKKRGDFSLKQSSNPESRVWQDTIPVESTIFKMANYADPEELQHEYEPYESETTMVALYEGDEAVGEIRIIDYNPAVGFKTIHDIREGRLDIDEKGRELLDALDLEETFEVGTIGLKEGYRTQPGDEMHPITQLYGMIYTYGLDNGKPYVLASYDEKYLGRFEGMYGAALTRLGPAKEYMGSPTVPVFIDLRRMQETFRTTGLGEFEEMLFAAGRNVERDVRS